jgi:phospholipase C
VSAHSEKALKDTSAAAQADTKSPIKHVIILIGENRGLDHTFGVYIPKGRGETISNLVSKGIVKRDGSPGPNFHLSQQFAVTPNRLGISAFRTVRA